MTLQFIVNNKGGYSLAYGGTRSILSIEIVKNMLGENTPYIIENTNGNNATVFNYHFLREVRRHLSGDVAFSRFSEEESSLYNKYVDYLGGIDFSNSKYFSIITALDHWLLEEVRQQQHAEHQVVVPAVQI